MSDTQMLLVAGYPDVDLAEREFRALADKVAAKEVSSQGVILVGKGPDGEPRLMDTGNHLGRRGAGWGGGAGVLVGLFAPPMLGAVAVGAAAGAVVGHFAGNKLTAAIQGQVGAALKAGSAVIIGVFPADARLAVERALPGAPLKSVVESDERGIDALKEALAEAMGKFSPDRTVLPIQDRSFGGIAGHTIDESVGDWSIVAGAKAPDDAPNVLIVLIDDAGFGGPDTFGGGIRTPNLTRVQQQGITYNRFHVTAVCSPTRAALLTGRNHHRVGMGGIAEFPGPFPGYTGVRPRACTALPRILRENGYVTAGFGKWHITPGREMGAAGPFDHWPTGWGFDHWWGFLTGAAGQYDPIITQDNSTLGVPEGEDGKLYYFPDDITDKTVEWLHAVRAQDADKPWFVYYSTGATHAPHHVAKEWADKYKGQFDEGWDVYRERTLERQKKLGIVPPDTELTPRPDAYPAWDGLSDGRAPAVRPADGGVRRLLRERRLERRPPPRRRRGDGRARQHPHPLHLGRQRRLDGGHAHRVVQRDHVLQRPRARRRGAAGPHRQVRRHRRARRASTPPRTSRRPGRTRTTRPSSGASRWPATSAAPATRW